MSTSRAARERTSADSRSVTNPTTSSSSLPRRPPAVERSRRARASAAITSACDTASRFRRPWRSSSSYIDDIANNGDSRTVEHSAYEALGLSQALRELAGGHERVVHGTRESLLGGLDRLMQCKVVDVTDDE